MITTKYKYWDWTQQFPDNTSFPSSQGRYNMKDIVLIPAVLSLKFLISLKNGSIINILISIRYLYDSLFIWRWNLGTLSLLPVNTCNFGSIFAWKSDSWFCCEDWTLLLWRSIASAAPSLPSHSFSHARMILYKAKVCNILNHSEGGLLTSHQLLSIMQNHLTLTRIFTRVSFMAEIEMCHVH